MGGLPSTHTSHLARRAIAYLAIAYLATARLATARLATARLATACLAVLFAACASDSARRPGSALYEIDARVPVSAELTLAGTLTRPALPPDRRPPVVVLVSGSGAQGRDGTRVELPGYRPFRDLAQGLGAAGIAVLRLDDRGTGASSGRFAGATTLDFAGDVGAALRWLRTRPDVDGAHPVLLGHSEGAVVAMLVASRDTTVSALVLMGAPSRTGRELARWQRAGFVATDAAAFPPADRGALLARAEVDAERLAAQDAWMRMWFSLDPRAVARATTAPALLLHGENDRQVPVEQAEELASVLASVAASRGAAGDARAQARAPTPRAVALRRFAATDHLFLEDHDGDPRGYVRLTDRRVRPNVIEAIVHWLATRSVANDD